jgi:hypothetical protein
VYHPAMELGAKTLIVLTACQRAAEVLPDEMTTNQNDMGLAALQAAVNSTMSMMESWPAEPSMEGFVNPTWNGEVF